MRMRLGRVNLYLVSDGIYWSDGGGLFGLVPKVLWQRLAETDERNRLEFAMYSLLIEADGKRILIDTGYGDKLSDKEKGHLDLKGDARLIKNLASIGVGPEDIDVVVNTHLHGDHCGGNTTYDERGMVVPVFPRATYVVQRLELADAMYPNERTRATYRRENIQPLQEREQLAIVNGDTRLTDSVRLAVMPGHTRAHQCVIVESEEQRAVFLGDLASWPIHIERLAWVPAYDVEPLVSIETKRNLARWAIEHHALLIFEHHPEIVSGYLYSTAREDRFLLEPGGFISAT